MLEDFRVDLHIHSCLSPCADDAMIPGEIVGRAALARLDWIGIADHNGASNLAVVREAGAKIGLAVSAGMEIATVEEIHLLGFFDELESVLELERIVDAHLGGENDEEAFGRQLVVSGAGVTLATHPKLLIGATTLTAVEVVSAIRRLGGVAIASHVDRPSFSIVSQLGFIPEELELDGAELSPLAPGAEAERAWSERLGLEILRFSDAHAPEDIGRSFSRVRAAAPTVAELALALRGEGGRGVLHG